jgi:predicted PurR-regulated permease PerM
MKHTKQRNIKLGVLIAIIIIIILSVIVILLLPIIPNIIIFPDDPQTYSTPLKYITDRILWLVNDLNQINEPILRSVMFDANLCEVVEGSVASGFSKFSCTYSNFGVCTWTDDYTQPPLDNPLMVCER